MGARNGFSSLLVTGIQARLQAGSSLNQETVRVFLDILGDQSLEPAAASKMGELFFRSDKLLDAAVVALAEHNCEATVLTFFRSVEQLARTRVVASQERRKKAFRVKSFALGL